MRTSFVQTMREADLFVDGGALAFIGGDLAHVAVSTLTPMC